MNELYNITTPYNFEEHDEGWNIYYWMASVGLGLVFAFFGIVIIKVIMDCCKSSDNQVLVSHSFFVNIIKTMAVKMMGFKNPNIRSSLNLERGRIILASHPMAVVVADISMKEVLQMEEVEAATEEEVETEVEVVVTSDLDINDTGTAFFVRNFATKIICDAAT